ncbi:MAG: hypothetical protein FWG45_04305 [Oscillospiraceae bacterium]|nr:hypothetical protein [Oscillospiraceae bacterium]
MKKKVLASLMAVAMVLTLAACGFEGLDASGGNTSNDDTTQESTTGVASRFPDESDITDICYIALHDGLYKDYSSQWVRISGMVTEKTDSNITFKQNLVGNKLTNAVSIKIDNFNGFDDVKQDDWVTIVGVVGLKLLGLLSISDATIENVGMESKELYEELKTTFEGQGGEESDDDTAGTAEESQETPQDETTESPIATISAKAFYEEYNDNSLAADKKYKGELVVITGKVGSVNKDILGKTYLTIDADEYGIRSIQCYFKNEDDLLTLKKGDYVEVQGTVGSVVITAPIIEKCNVK